MLLPPVITEIDGIDVVGDGAAHQLDVEIRKPFEEIMDKLRGHTSGLAIPAYVIDAPGGGGKIPILPQYVLGRNGNNIIMRNFKYEIYEYPDVEEEEKKVSADQQQIEKKYLRKRKSVQRKK